MASGSDGDHQNDVASSPPRTEENVASSPPRPEETPAAKRQRFTPTTQTPPSLPSSSSDPRIPPSGNSVHAPPLPNLPFELIVEILSRIPVKFLLQLRCICKSWKTLISDPIFAKKHLHDSPTKMNLILIFTNSSREFVLWSYPLSSVLNAVTTGATQLRYPLNNQNRFDLIAGSCNGILCFAIDQNYSLLWNPSIGKFKILPSLENPKRVGSFTIYGFGYDPFGDSYKVVAVFCYQCRSGSTSGYKTEVKIYTLGTDYWRRIEDFPSGVPFDESGKFVNGTVNWLVSTPTSSSMAILSLDLGKESYQELLLPGYGVVVHTWLSLEVLRDCLCILSQSDTFSDVWLMKEFGNRESWTKLFSVPLLDYIPYHRALCISENDQVLLHDDAPPVVYESRNGNFKIPQFENTSKWAYPEVYSESLISPCF